MHKFSYRDVMTAAAMQWLLWFPVFVSMPGAHRPPPTPSYLQIAQVLTMRKKVYRAASSQQNVEPSVTGVVWLCTPAILLWRLSWPFILSGIRAEAMTHGSERDTDSVPPWYKGHCTRCSPVVAPGKGSEKRNATHSVESSKCYWLGQSVKEKQVLKSIYFNCKKKKKKRMKKLTENP